MLTQDTKDYHPDTAALNFHRKPEKQANILPPKHQVYFSFYLAHFTSIRREVSHITVRL
jgi:hypothetical protein